MKKIEQETCIWFIKAYLRNSSRKSNFAMKKPTPSNSPSKYVWKRTNQFSNAIYSDRLLLQA